MPFGKKINRGWGSRKNIFILQFQRINQNDYCNGIRIYDRIYINIQEKSAIHFDILTYFKKELIIVSTKLTDIVKYFH